MCRTTRNSSRCQGARRGAPVCGGFAEPLQDRDAERERLPGPGPSLADEIVSVEGDRQGQRLDRERCRDSRCLERAADRLGDPEVAERTSAALGLLFVERVRLSVRFLRRVLHVPYICCQGFRLHQWPAVPPGP